MSQATDLLTGFPISGGEDVISLTKTSTGDSTVVVFSLETAGNIDWWKGLTLYSPSGATLGSVHMQDHDHGPKSFSAMPSELVGTRLELVKAKWPWQAHVEMYEMQNLSGQGGKSFQFLWQMDNDGAGPFSGFFRDLSGAISDAADAVATWVETAIGTVAEVVGFIFEFIGGFIASFSDFMGDLLGGIPKVGPFLKRAFHWAGTVASAILDLVATSLRASLDGLANLIGGSIRIGGGILAWNSGLIGKGFTGAAAGLVGSSIAILAKSVASVQATFFMQLGERELTLSEKEMLTRVYRSSVNLTNVRVIDGFAGIFSVTAGGFTLGNKIYMKDNAANYGGTDSKFYRFTLVHECCHVWQNQHIGTRYISDALYAHQTLGDGSDGAGAYSWQNEITRGNFRWQDFNKEAQAKFLQDVFTDGKRVFPLPEINPDGDFYNEDPVGADVEFSTYVDGIDTAFTDLARESVAYVRGAHWPLSKP